jgi:hypothetical protein
MRVYTEAKEVPLQGALEVQKARCLMSNLALYIWLQVQETLPLRLLSLQSKWPVRFRIRPLTWNTCVSILNVSSFLKGRIWDLENKV